MFAMEACVNKLADMVGISHWEMRYRNALQKALRGLEVGVDGMNQHTTDREELEKELGEPGPERI